MSEVLLELEDVVVLHRTDPTGPFGLWGARPIRAVDGVSLSLAKGETLGLMGGSGAGKTTLAEAATLRRPIDRGRILLQGEDVKSLDRKRARRRLQIIRQDVRESLDMDRTVRKQLGDALKEYQLPEGDGRIARALEQVDLQPDQFLDRTPKQMSGGQQQRVAIARALALNPLGIALDEPVAAVDPHLREELCRLLERVQKQQGTAYLLISQDPQTISRLAHRVAVMHEGRIVEVGPTQSVLGEPLHPFSRRFLGREQGPLPAEDDMAGRAYRGCPWAAHCPVKTARCEQEAPPMREVAPGRFVACSEV